MTGILINYVQDDSSSLHESQISDPVDIHISALTSQNG